ncbi:hypothetical protein ACRS6B_00110 [Nocardia asteroides]
MEPDRSSPYWDAIVGDNWPSIAPGDWSALERRARDGAAALDLLEARGRHRDFDERVRASAGLDPVKEDMLRQSMNPQAFADALEAAADTFRDFSDLVYRTRNQILDVVDEATSRINATKRAAAAEEDEFDAQAIRNRIPGIIASARADVEDIARTALGAIGPNDLPSLDRIADALGRPGPWIPGNHGGPEDHAQHRPATDHSGNPRHDPPPGPKPPQDGAPVPVSPNGVDQQPTTDPVGPPLPGDELVEQPNLDSALPEDTSVVPPSTNYVPDQRTPGGTTTLPFGAVPGTVPDDRVGLPPAGGSPRTQITDTEPVVAGPDDAPQEEHQGAATPDGSAPDGADRDAPVEAAVPGDHDRSPTVTASESHAGAAPERSIASSVPVPSPGVASVDAPYLLPPPVMAPAFAPPPASAVPVNPSGPAVSAPAAQANPGSPPASSKPSAPPTETRGPVASPRVTAVGAGSPSSAGSPSGAGSPPGAGGSVKAPPPGTAEQRTDAARGEGDDSDESIRDVVGAAMTSAAAPAFVLGERVDGDLVLARTLLSGVLAAGGDAVLGLGWAVSVMRHPSGISAFVTSNEGRGWLPAGLYLPRELSTPWVWDISEGNAWEGVADPARVLAEFAIAWGRKSGARLTAVVASGEIDTELRRQLGEVPMEGEVAASSAMDFSAPRPSLVDRLELVGAPALVQRAVSTPEAEIAARRWDLASDAHVRLRKAGLGSAAALGAPAVRERILTALRQRREIPQEWWEELRDANDLLTATMLARRADVSRVALGELRAEQADGRHTSDMNALRGMVFERRCDELVLLLAEAATRQSLRDAVYAHAQIVGHPAFVAPAPAPAGGPARRPTITAGPGH